MGREHMKDIWMGSSLRKLTWLAAALSALAAAVGLGTATAPAYASGLVSVRAHSVTRVAQQDNVPQVCGLAGTGYCLNDWNGAIGDINMYYGGYANDYFEWFSLPRCNGNSLVLGAPYYCPFADHTLDNNLAGHLIFEIESGVNPDWCLGTSSSSSLTIMQPCADLNTGAGGGDGVVLVQTQNSNCGGTGNQMFIDRYWSDRYSTEEYLETGGNIGVQANADYSGSNPTCWGQDN
jgi:hypothetical protein